MKSIIYLSDYSDRPCRPVLIKHDGRFNAYEHYKHHDLRYTGTHYQLRYVCTIDSDMSIHEKINRRAEHIGKTAWNYGHHLATPPDWTDRRRTGPDYQWHSSGKRIARSRFRHAKRQRRIGGPYLGYACIDFSFGLWKLGDDLNDREHQHLFDRRHLAATSRAPLPPWSLIQCYETQAA